jgi:hypothetical protein
MVRHQAIGVGFGDGGDVFSVFFQKVIVIGLVPENILKAIRMVENMVAAIGLQWFHLFNIDNFSKVYIYFCSTVSIAIQIDTLIKTINFRKVALVSKFTIIQRKSPENQQ